MSAAAERLHEPGAGLLEPEGPAWAYERCEAITREQAANFYYGIRLLSARKRQAMCAVYAFARRVDDIGDGDLPAPQKLARLDTVAADLRALVSRDAREEGGGRRPEVAVGPGDAQDPVMVALADARRRFPLPDDALSELVEGVRMDVLGASYETFDELLPYCRRVAGGIGRLCLAIFGARELSSAAVLADELGVAMQLTNIIRDIREDSENGRVYLPAEDLRRFGLHRCADPRQLAALARIGADAIPRVVAGDGGGDVGQLLALVRFEAQRAERWFERGLRLIDHLDRRSAACVLAMSGIYRRLLARIEAHPEESLARRMSLSTPAKLMVAARSLLGVGP